MLHWNFPGRAQIEVRGRARGMGFGQGRARPGENYPYAEPLVREGTPVINKLINKGENAADPFKNV